MTEILASYAIGMTGLAVLAMIRVGVERAHHRPCPRPTGDPDELAAGCRGCGLSGPRAPAAGEEES